MPYAAKDEGWLLDMDGPDTPDPDDYTEACFDSLDARLDRVEAKLDRLLDYAAKLDAIDLTKIPAPLRRMLGL